MSSPHVIAVAQTIPVRGDLAANTRQHLRLIQAAAGAGAHVLAFPELSLTGYELDLADRLAFLERDERLAPLADAAASAQMTVIAGAPVRIQSRLHIGAFVLAPDGSIDVYTKHYLGACSPAENPGGPVPMPEATVFQPGSRNPQIRFGRHIAALAVCADTGQPGHAGAAASSGATAYLAGVFSTPGEFDKDAARLKSYAGRHSMLVAMANFGGPSGGLAAAGRSSIWSENGELVGEASKAGLEVLIASERATGWHCTSARLADA